jgi:amino acid transporter
MPFAGGLAAYTVAGFGPRAGLVVGWCVVLAYASILMFVWSYMGIIIRDEVRIVAPGFPGWTWVPIGLLIAGAVIPSAIRDLPRAEVRETARSHGTCANRPRGKCSTNH